MQAPTLSGHRRPYLTTWAQVYFETGERAWVRLSLWVVTLDDRGLDDLGEDLADMIQTHKEERKPIDLGEVADMMRAAGGYWAYATELYTIYRTDNGPNCVCLIVQHDR